MSNLELVLLTLTNSKNNPVLAVKRTFINDWGDEEYSYHNRQGHGIGICGNINPENIIIEQDYQEQKPSEFLKDVALKISRSLLGLSNPLILTSKNKMEMAKYLKPIYQELNTIAPNNCYAGLIDEAVRYGEFSSLKDIIQELILLAEDVRDFEHTQEQLCKSLSENSLMVKIQYEFTENEERMRSHIYLANASRTFIDYLLKTNPDIPQEEFSVITIEQFKEYLPPPF